MAMQVEVRPETEDSLVWSVDVFDTEVNREAETAVFTGPNAKDRAHLYSLLMKSFHGRVVVPFEPPVDCSDQALITGLATMMLQIPRIVDDVARAFRRRMSPRTAATESELPTVGGEYVAMAILSVMEQLQHISGAVWAGMDRGIMLPDIDQDRAAMIAGDRHLKVSTDITPITPEQVIANCISEFEIAKNRGWCRPDAALRDLLKQSITHHHDSFQELVLKTFDEQQRTQQQVEQEQQQGPDLNNDIDAGHRARALHRVVRAMHDGHCPKCGHLAPSSEFYYAGGLARIVKGVDLATNVIAYKLETIGGHRCPSCKFTIIDDEAENALAEFQPYMADNVKVFEEWRATARANAKASEVLASDAGVLMVDAERTDAVGHHVTPGTGPEQIAPVE